MATSSILQRISRHPLWPYFIALLCVGALVFAGYSLYLDNVVRIRFEGSRWALPAQVYARPLELYPGLDLDAADLKRELERMGYRSVPVTNGPGTFHAGSSAIELTSRQFAFWDGLQASHRIAVSFDEAGVRTVTDMISGSSLRLIRLDPLLIGSIYPAQGEDRALVKLKEVPPMLPEGLISVEDRRFRKHNGVDPRSIIRAVFANMIAGHVVQGGSTITQQLVKNFYLDNRQTFGRKLNEALMALLLEAHFSKNEILEAYINEVYLGQDGNRAVHGFGLGSYFYFQKPLNELQPHEIALLVALVKGPSYYDPRRHADRIKERRDLVLDTFAEDDLLTKEQAAAYKTRPLGVTRQGAGTTQYPAFVELVRQQLRGHYKDEDLTNEGLRIFTTLDPRIQAAIENSVNQGLEALEKGRALRPGTLESAAVVTSTDGGEVLGLVGGREARYEGFNRALEARRPIGSLAKPMVYLTALSRPQEFNLLTQLRDEELEVPLPSGQVWRPQNYDEDFRGKVDLHQALEHSVNIPAVKIALQVGLPSVAETFKRLGYPGNVLAVPALALGSIDMTPVEVAQIYGTLASGGYYSPLLTIREVMTKEGRSLGHYPLQIRQAFPEAPVYLLNWALERVMHVGTAASAYSVLPPTLRVAGKTGTTNDLRDSWFAGFSGNRVAVVWVGRDDNQPSRFTGATGALTIWTRILRDIKPQSFAPTVPEDIEQFPFDVTETKHSSDSCDNPVMVPFIRGSMPGDFEPCDQWPEGVERPAGYSSGHDDNSDRSDRNDKKRKKKRGNGGFDWFFDLFR